MLEPGDQQVNRGICVVGVIGCVMESCNRVELPLFSTMVVLAEAVEGGPVTGCPDCCPHHS
jgi:hypothetical protein